MFVMPLYYYSWPAALKTVVDRFYSFSSELSSMGKKTVIIAAAWENSTSLKNGHSDKTHYNPYKSS